jgi:hypothetical protein
VSNLNGLIQHSFAVRVSRDLGPRYAEEGVPDAHALLRTIFETSGWRLGEAGMERSPREVGGDGPWDHSALVRHRQTTIEPHPFPYKEERTGSDIPTLLDWSTRSCQRYADLEDPWEGFVIGGADRPVETSHKDYLLELDKDPSTETFDRHASEGVALSRLLCQLLAHRRSRLFGLPLARETINVLLPHALFKPGEVKGLAGDGWFVQPMLSLFYVYGRRGFRPIFSFSLFLIPCNCSSTKLTSRPMSEDEMHDSVRNQWPLATAFNPEERPAFTVLGPLCKYLAAVAEPAMGSLDIGTTDGMWTARASANYPELRTLTLRMFTEATLFAVTLRMANGNCDLPPEKTRKEIGDRVLTALSASRVSSVVVVDDNCAAAHSASGKRKTCRPSDLSWLLANVSRAISRPYRVPSRIPREGRDGYRLDRNFFDTDRYAIAVLPANRCVVTVGDRCAQHGFESSALLEAGWTAYMVIGAATATGMIRSVFRDISRSDRSKPDSIADIEREAMVELHETYDLEIMTETYRRRYRLLRKHLGITAEFEALSDKLEALYRETSTRFEGKSEKRLQLLTWATAILSAVIAAGTLVLIFKGG